MRAFRAGELAILTGILVGSPVCAAVKVQMIEGRPLVDGVYVNGHGPYRFLLDTGTTANHLDPKIARSIGFKPAFRTELISSTGITYAPGVDGIEVVLDSVRADGQRFLFAGIDVIQQIAPSVQGVLGQAFLSHFDYLLNLREKRIEFGKRAPQGNRNPDTPSRLTGPAGGRHQPGRAGAGFRHALDHPLRRRHQRALGGDDHHVGLLEDRHRGAQASDWRPHLLAR
jgi:hypothetical protein